MEDPAQRRRRRNTSGTRFALFLIGWLLIILSPIVGVFPGPGFVIFFPLGLALILQNSRWAKKKYVDFKRRYPAYGKWTDYALRRRRAGKMPKLPDFLRWPRKGKSGGNG